MSKNRLHCGGASFETRPSGAPQDEETFDGIKKIPHPEEAAKQLSRRTHRADPAYRQFPDGLVSGAQGKRESLSALGSRFRGNDEGVAVMILGW